LPQIEGLKAHSILFEANTDAAALFVELNNGKEMEHYPRPDGTLYVCGEGEDDSSMIEEIPGKEQVENGRINLLRKNCTTISSIFGDDDKHVLREAACHLPVVISSTGSPIICEIDKGSKCFVATGHSCWGILQSPGTGKVLSELIAGCETSVDMKDFQIPAT
jgi:glycine/D-amino acid oxidase-like deaminating enzyme